MGDAYANTEEITAKEISPESKSVTDEMKDKAASAADAIDTIFRNFGHYIGVTKEGQGLYDLVVVPIAGDFNRIKANGEAWADVGDMLSKIFHNYLDNAEKLTLSDWKGDAADAFVQHVDVAWGAGLYVAKRVTGWMRKGFDKLADLCLDLAKECAQIFRTLVDRIVKLCSKAVPIYGWAVALVDWIAEGFDEFPYWGDIDAIKQMIQQILQIHKTVEKLVSAAKSYLECFKQAVDAVKAIPEVVVKTADQIDEAYEQGLKNAKQLRDQIETKADTVQENLDEMQNTAEKDSAPRGPDTNDPTDNHRPDYPR
jgi:hypothetical protein